MNVLTSPGPRRNPANHESLYTKDPQRFNDGWNNCLDGISLISDEQWEEYKTQNKDHKDWGKTLRQVAKDNALDYEYVNGWVDARFQLDVPPYFVIDTAFCDSSKYALRFRAQVMGYDHEAKKERYFTIEYIDGEIGGCTNNDPTYTIDGKPTGKMYDVPPIQQLMFGTHGRYNAQVILNTPMGCPVFIDQRYEHSDGQFDVYFMGHVYRIGQDAEE